MKVVFLWVLIWGSFREVDDDGITLTKELVGSSCCCCCCFGFWHNDDEEDTQVVVVVLIGGGIVGEETFTKLLKGKGGELEVVAISTFPVFVW